MTTSTRLDALERAAKTGGYSMVYDMTGRTLDVYIHAVNQPARVATMTRAEYENWTHTRPGGWLCIEVACDEQEVE